MAKALVGRGFTVNHRPNLNAAAVLLGSENTVPVDRTAMLIPALLGVEVSTGFLARLRQRLDAAGFDEAMKTALRAEDVVCGEESPTNVLFNDLEGSGNPVPGAPHAVTVRTPHARLVW